MDLFRSQPAPSNHTRTIKTWVAELFPADADAAILVTELRCTEQGCPPVETVIAILRPGGQQQAKIHKSIAAVERSDIEGLRFG